MVSSDSMATMRSFLAAERSAYCTLPMASV
jgi:hypothetical protein